MTFESKLIERVAAMTLRDLFLGKPKPSLLPKASEPIVLELDKELERDEKFIGEVFRRLSKGITPDEIAKAEGHKNSKNVVSFEYAIRGLRGDTLAKNIKYNSRDQMIFAAERLIAFTSNPELKSYLQNKLNEVKPQANFETTDAATPAPVVPKPEPTEKPVMVQTTLESKVEAKPGVYVYSYPQYLSMEAVSPDGRAFYKIGASGKVANRVERQKRQTEVPEDLVLVRVFYDENPFELEEKFHSILRAANMHQKTTQGGVEWFSCNLATIDAIAGALGNSK